MKAAILLGPATIICTLFFAVSGHAFTWSPAAWPAVLASSVLVTGMATLIARARQAGLTIELAVAEPLTLPANVGRLEYAACLVPADFGEDFAERAAVRVEVAHQADGARS